MKNKIIACTIISGILLVGVAIFGAYGTMENDKKVLLSAADTGLQLSKPNDELLNIPIGSSQSLHFDGNLKDYCNSLEELRSNADIIVVGKVEKQEQFSNISTMTYFKASKTIKGRNFDTVKIFQLGRVGDVDNYELLKQDGEYILFLGKQTDDKEDTFYIKGGVQGLFINQNGKLTNFDPKMKDELKKVEKNNDKNQLNELENLINFAKIPG